MEPVAANVKALIAAKNKSLFNCIIFLTYLTLEVLPGSMNLFGLPRLLVRPYLPRQAPVGRGYCRPALNIHVVACHRLNRIPQRSLYQSVARPCRRIHVGSVNGNDYAAAVVATYDDWMHGLWLS